MMFSSRHATEDKESFGREFVDILQQKFHLKVWYDTVSIKWGDSTGRK